MVNELIETRIKRCRGIMLQVLGAEKKIAGHRPAAPVDLLVIQSILTRFGIHKSMDHMIDQAEYLEGRKYIKINNVAMVGVSATLLEITERGISLLDGLVSDDTIMIG